MVAAANAEVVAAVAVATLAVAAAGIATKPDLHRKEKLKRATFASRVARLHCLLTPRITLRRIPYG